jgi:hypothetical protein
MVRSRPDGEEVVELDAAGEVVDHADEPGEALLAVQVQPVLVTHAALAVGAVKVSDVR